MGFLYLFICFATGYVLCTYLLPGLSEATKRSFRNQAIDLWEGFVLLPAWFISGTLVVTWSTYLLAFLFQRTESPLRYGNAISMSVFLLVFLIVLFVRKPKSQGLDGVLPDSEPEGKDLQSKSFFLRKLQGRFWRLTAGELVFLILVFFGVFQLMWRTFSVEDGTLSVGLSVFSDFAPHLGMIRSFSLGNNFPTMYSHYAGEDIRYHFMFQFLAGNLEFLGMRIDMAFNLISALSLVSAFSLLYVLAVRLSGRRAVGYLGALFFAFRCSPSVFTYFARIPEGQSVWKTARENIEFIGYTTNENWGLWNLNVYCNQRHLAFGISALLLVLILFLPKLFAMAERWGEEKRKEKGDVVSFLRFSFFSVRGWTVKSVLQPVVLSCLLGLTAFWNGATLLATVMVLFVLAIISDYRLEYLITAVITAVLSLLQNALFMDGLAVGGAKLQFGFIAENRSLFGTLDYIARLTGILFLVLLVAFVVSKGVKRWVLAAFAAPFVFSFFVSLTSDVTVNHKYIMISVMLMNLFAADLLVKLFSHKNTALRVLVVGIVIVMTATGYYDYRTVLRRNNPAYNLKFSMDDPLVEWIDKNTDSKDIFLTPHYALSRPVLGGAMLFEGHAYYPMTAGYDTDKRYALTKKMFEAASVEELRSMIEENGIDYIIIDIDARQSMDYELNEAVFEAAYEPVYTEGDGEWKLTVYDVRKAYTEMKK